MPAPLRTLFRRSAAAKFWLTVFWLLCIVSPSAANDLDRLKLADAVEPVQ
jgi:hypothetical protein